MNDSYMPVYEARTHCILHYAFIQSDLQLIRLSDVGLRALLKGSSAVQILSWPHQGSDHRPCGSKSSSLTTMLQAALELYSPESLKP